MLFFSPYTNQANIFFSVLLFQILKWHRSQDVENLLPFRCLANKIPIPPLLLLYLYASFQHHNTLSKKQFLKFLGALIEEIIPLGNIVLHPILLHKVQFLFHKTLQLQFLTFLALYLIENPLSILLTLNHSFQHIFIYIF